MIPPATRAAMSAAAEPFDLDELITGGFIQAHRNPAPAAMAKFRAWRAAVRSGHTQTEVANWFGCRRQAVNQGLKHLERRGG